MGLTRVAQYAQVNAVVHALYAEKLTAQTMRELVAAEQFGAVLTLLASTPYRAYLDIPSNLLTPRRVVYQLHIYLSDVYRKIIQFMPKSGQSLISVLWQAYEVDNLKAILRGLYHHSTWDQVLFLLSPINRHNLVKLDKLRQMLETGDIGEAISLLKSTPYYYPLSYAVNRYQEENTLFPLEIALDLDYRRRYWSEIDQLRGEDQTYALQLLGAVLDKDKLIWALRFRYYHHLSAEEIINYTLERGYHLQDREIRIVARGGCIQANLEDKYPSIEGLDQICTHIERNIGVLEHKLENDIQEKCRLIFRSGPFHMGVPLAYLLMLEHEIRALTAIIEAKATPTDNVQNLALMLESYV